MDDLELNVSRRKFLADASALIIGAAIPFRKGMAREMAITGENAFVPNAFVRIGTDDVVTVISKHIEFGQGSHTGMATLVAEELDADWSTVRVETAPANAAIYGHLLYKWQGTGGSSAIAEAHEQMRRMGAMARRMLMQAAAKKWNVRIDEIRSDSGTLIHASSGRRARYGEFASLAATLKAPDATQLPLKSPADFRLIGKTSYMPRVDSLAKCNGSALFSMDVHEPDMLTVVIRKPPRIGGKVKSFDATHARAVPGVIDVRQIDTGVAVYATGTWAAIQGRERVDVVWDESNAQARGTAKILDHFRTIAGKSGAVAEQRGDIDKAFAGADKVIEAEFAFPYVAHAPMEPLNGYLFWDGHSVKARYGCHMTTFDQTQLAGLFGLPLDKVEIETTYVGGSFGRRIDLGNKVMGPDLAADMAAAAKGWGPGRGIKVVWTREDDISGGWYRPMILHRMKAAIRNGRLSAWHDRIVGHSFGVDSVLASRMPGGADKLMVEGAANMLYDVENFLCDAHIVQEKIPTSSLRSVGSTHTAFAVERFIDEILESLGQDAVEGRLALLRNAPREAGVLRVVAQAANWRGGRVEGGRAMGVAVGRAFYTSVAQIAEVSIGPGGVPRVHKVWCAVDCGMAVNPDVIRAQIEGGTGYGLGIALFGQVTVDQGRVVQSNFNDYRVLRHHEMPEIEVIIVPSQEKPTGVGELGVPMIAPAVASALTRLGRPKSSLQLPLGISPVST
ncbi:xanthine dehydrogenase family protein molybdopterin-binding subunit [Paraburkholderia caribensis]|uniref:xanthine dehydrogenase family protein molybdopterin-binding subunit n=1 Tax=Paraburkholderia caribensis TaxID=75105 RepID=UPI001CAEE084|nr:molybdopterin cofactor-binding domain-containing protein [Paraburkholderia caribensis]CAG9269691.1 Isoquinoline 1-oxidoreductase beta subunit [Paraburkholderia caribensis]